MNSAIGRDLLSQVVVVLGVCIGAWTLVVEPKASALAEREAEVALGRDRLAAADFERIATIASQVPEIRVSAADIEARSRVARDSAGLYALIMALAQQQQIVVRNLQPKVPEVRETANVLVTQIDMTVEGDYERLAGFIESLHTVEAHMRIASFSIIPIEHDEKRSATMQLGCEALAFKVPADVAQLGEGRP